MCSAFICIGLKSGIATFMRNTNSTNDKYSQIVKNKYGAVLLRIIMLPFFGITFGLFLLIGCTSSKKGQTSQESKASGIQQKSRIVTQEMSAFYNAIYLQKEGGMLLSENRISEDNGRIWKKYNYSPDFYSGLPHGFRRDKLTSVLDPHTNRIITIVNSLNTPGLDPKVNEPPEAQFTYYLRYLVSNNAGKTWQYDEPIIHEGNYTESNPFEEINIGKNSFYIGDLGCIPIVTKKGKILVPAQMTIAGEDGELSNPGGGRSYTDVLILIGTWTEDGKLTWKSSQRVKGDPKRSTRGMIEPTLIEMKDGRILMVMRGSNGFKFDEDNKLPSYKWHSVSDDGGETWTKPEPWGFEDGEPFFPLQPCQHFLSIPVEGAFGLVI